METIFLLIECPDKTGIVAKIAEWIFQAGGNIVRSDQHTTDPLHGIFFMRVEFTLKEKKPDLEIQFSQLAKTLGANWKIYYKNQKLRMGILVSQLDHCLVDILYHWHCGDIHAEIPFIISNHETCKEHALRYNIPFYYLPVNAEIKSHQEQQILAFAKNNSDFLVLARYMQILSVDFLRRYEKDIINIHHSFLPAFIGANPYKQAYDRGVKIIGATAHFVTTDLDEGPIIAQGVEKTSHRDSVIALKRKGRNLEELTLMNAIEAYVEHRIIRFGNKTVVFD